MTDSTDDHNKGLHQDDANTPTPIIATVLFLRLGCGDDIICWAVPLEDAIKPKWYISNPVVVVMEIDADLQKQTIIMYPWLPRGVVDSNDALIGDDEVILVKKVDKHIEEYYKNLCKDIFAVKPTVIDTNKKLVEKGKNVFAFDPRMMRPNKKKSANNEESKANT